MATTLKKMMGNLSVERRRRVDARAKVLIAEELTLRDLRNARDLTQERMGEILGIGQDSVSRIEKRSDLLLSTLRDVVRAMGGSLELVAQFPDRPPVMLGGLTGTSKDETKPKRKGKAAKRAMA